MGLLDASAFPDAWVHCIHCGMCLPTCPTYDLSQEELHSPRGRIQLIRGLATGEIATPSEAFRTSMEFCLGCYACETACPAGVHYSPLFEHAREVIEHLHPQRLKRFILKHIFPHPRRLKVLARFLDLASRMRLPERVARWKPVVRRFPSLPDLLPFTPPVSRRFSDAMIAPVEQPADIPPRHHVGFLTGCVMNLSFAKVNRQTVDLLLLHGARVYTPRTQVCCGALHGHNGYLSEARRLARRNIAAFERACPPERMEAIVVNAAGCGAFMKSYGDLLHRDPRWAGRARRFSQKVRDITEYLADLPRYAPRHPVPLKATYHDACHLAHAQGIVDPPRRLLAEIPELKLIPLPESTWCCGSAGIYNLLQPEASLKLLERKMQHIRSTGATVVITGNPGCHIQIQGGALRFGPPVKVIHTVSLLHRSYFGASGLRGSSPPSA